MSLKLKQFDIAEYLDSEETIREYLRQVFEDGSTAEILRAFDHVAKAKGMDRLAKNTGLGREGLDRTFEEGAKPSFDTILKISRALNVPLTVSVDNKNRI